MRCRRPSSMDCQAGPNQTQDDDCSRGPREQPGSRPDSQTVTIIHPSSTPPLSNPRIGTPAGRDAAFNRRMRKPATASLTPKFRAIPGNRSITVAVPIRAARLSKRSSSVPSVLSSFDLVSLRAFAAPRQEFFHKPVSKRSSSALSDPSVLSGFGLVSLRASAAPRQRFLHKSDSKRFSSALSARSVPSGFDFIFLRASAAPRQKSLSQTRQRVGSGILPNF